MTSALSCVVNPSTSQKDYSNLFGYVCGKNPSACAGIAANGQKGQYGAYGMCDSSEQLSFVLNQYYLSQNKDSTACDFKGAAKLQTPKNAASSCKSLIAEAGKGGTGTVTSQPSGTGSSGGSGGASSSNAAAAVSVPSVESGFLPMMFIATVAAISGMGVLFL
jgi:hypothetical protein